MLSRRWRRGGVFSVPARTRGHVEWARSRLCPAVPVGARWSRGSRFPEDNWCAGTMLTPKQEGDASSIASVLRDTSSRRVWLFASNWAHATSQSASFRSQTPVIGLLQQLGNGAANGYLAALSGHTDLKAASETSGARLGGRMRWLVTMLRVAAALRPALRRRPLSSLAAAPTQLDGY